MPARGGSGRERLSGGPEGRSAARCPIRRQEAVYGYQGRVRPDPHFATSCIRRRDVMILLLILLLILLIGSVPAWGYSRDWGYYAWSTIGMILIIMLILLVLRTLQR